MMHFPLDYLTLRSSLYAARFIGRMDMALNSYFIGLDLFVFGKFLNLRIAIPWEQICFYLKK